MKRYLTKGLRGAPAAALLGLLLVILLGLLLVGCGGRQDWVTFRGTQGRGRAENAITPPLGIRWKLKLQRDSTSLAAFNPPVVLDDTIYFGSTDGNFYALDIESGYMRWTFSTDGPINSVPYADAANVYFGSVDGNAYALRREDGSEVWRFDTGRPVRSSVTRYEDMVMFASDAGSTFAVNEQGKELFSLPNLIWYYITFQVHDDVMYFAPGPIDNPRSLAAYNVKTGEHLWLLDTAMLNAVWYSFPAVDGDMLFMATGAPRGSYWELSYYGIDRHTGDILWRSTDISHFPDGYYVDPELLFSRNIELLDFMAPAVVGNRVIFTSGDATVRAFDTHSGELAWSSDLSYPTSSAPTIAGNTVYFGVHGELDAASEAAVTESPNDSPDAAPARLVALSTRNGSKEWEMPIDGAVLSAPVIAGRRILFGTQNSVFYILEALF
ncbi:MAG: PQQ-binding-like beta-propeller repeat protein [Spirochaeta sp.]|nr:PQQ-binding-like beta-propeller repeat protein [Spirochaeta sp.]